MLLKAIDQLSDRTFKKAKWLLTTLSGALTTGLIIVLES